MPSRPAPAAPSERLTRIVALVRRSRTNTSGKEASSSERLPASEVNATRLPSAEIAGSYDGPRAGSAPLLTSVVVPATMSRRKTSGVSVSWGPARLFASEAKAT